MTIPSPDHRAQLEASLVTLCQQFRFRGDQGALLREGELELTVLPQRDPNGKALLVLALTCGRLFQRHFPGAAYEVVRAVDGQVVESGVLRARGIAFLRECQPTEKYAVKLTLTEAPPAPTPLARRAEPLSETTLPGLIALLEGGDADVRDAAVRAIAGFGPAAAEAVPRLITALKDHWSSVRWHAAEALGRVGPPFTLAAVPALIAALQDGDADLRDASARALGGSGSTEALPALLELLGDPDAGVRQSAVAALGQTGPNVPRVQEALRTLLDDEDAEVRASVASVLSVSMAAVVSASPPGGKFRTFDVNPEYDDSVDLESADAAKTWILRFEPSAAPLFDLGGLRLLPEAAGDGDLPSDLAAVEDIFCAKLGPSGSFTFGFGCLGDDRGDLCILDLSLGENTVATGAVRFDQDTGRVVVDAAQFPVDEWRFYYVGPSNVFESTTGKRAVFAINKGHPPELIEKKNKPAEVACEWIRQGQFIDALVATAEEKLERRHLIIRRWLLVARMELLLKQDAIPAIKDKLKSGGYEFLLDELQEIADRKLDLVKQSLTEMLPH